MEVNPATSGAGFKKPRLAIVLIALLALIQVVRIAAFQLVQDVFAGRESVAWLYPGFVDIFIGITAPLVAFAVWRKTGLAVWVMALVWFSISIFDHLDALTTALNVAGPLPHSLPFASRSAFATSLLVSVAFEGIAFAWLTRGNMRSHYFRSPEPAAR
jgi:hypothetical protein